MQIFIPLLKKFIYKILYLRTNKFNKILLRQVLSVIVVAFIPFFVVIANHTY